jgi:hypothetical protein
MQISPNQQTTNINDTIWLSTAFDKFIELTDREETANIGQFANIEVTIQRISSPSTHQIFEENLIEAIQRKGVYETQTRYLSLDCSTDQCLARTGIVPKEKGIYAISLGEGSFENTDVYKCSPQNVFTENEFEVSNFNRNLIINTNHRIDSNSTVISPSFTQQWNSNNAIYFFEVL